MSALGLPGNIRPIIVMLGLLPLVGCGGDSEPDAPAFAVEVVDAGLQGPRAIIYDAAGDVYLVSNIGGRGLDEDEDGFVSRVSPDGEVLSLQWIPSAGSTVLLDAPKGMAIRGDTLFVTDIGCVRIANRVTAEVIETRCLDNVTSLSGIDVAPEGSLFLTDMGYELADGQLVPSYTDALYRVTFRADQRGSTLALGPDLNHPTGVAVGSRGIFVTTEGGDLLRFTPDGQRTSLIAAPGQIFEGVVFVADGGFAYSSSATGAVYLVNGSGAVSTLIDGISSPGDLGYDSNRNRLLIPLLDENRLLFVDL